MDTRTLIDELWPEVQAAEPKSSFEVTLSRLRRWIGVNGAPKLAYGRLALDARLVWRDACTRCIAASSSATRCPHPGP